MALIEVKLLKKSPKVVYVHTKIGGRGNFEIWIESADGTYFEKSPPASHFAQDISVAQYNLLKGRPDPLAAELALYPLTVLNPQSLTKGKND